VKQGYALQPLLFNFALKQDYKMEEKQWQQLVHNLGFFNNYIAKRLATFERNVLITMSGGIKVLYMKIGESDSMKN